MFIGDFEKRLQVPDRIVDAVLDTDTYNEIDDQFAVAYMLSSGEKINTKAIYAAPFHNSKSSGPEDGMRKSYDEIQKIISLMKRNDVEVYHGATQYLTDEKTPVISPAAQDLAKRAMDYSKDNPLYVIGIAAITNIASAILLNPEIVDRIVVVWLGGNSHDYIHTREFNMYQDVAAVRAVMKSGVAFVQLPCVGVVSGFRISKPEIESWLLGKNAISDFLATKVIEDTERYEKNPIWSRCIWDVTAVAWLLNDDDRFLESRIEHILLPAYDCIYESNCDTSFMRYVYFVKRDALMRDMIKKLTGYGA